MNSARQEMLAQYRAARMAHDARLRWGVSVPSIESPVLREVTVYHDEGEARQQLNLAQMDVPAVLVVDDGNGWMVAE